MFDLLFYSGIACTDAADMISRVKEHQNMNKIVITEIVETIKEATPECKWDAND